MAQKGTGMEPIRLNKFLSEQGICSRREADRLIKAGAVTIDGRTAVGSGVGGRKAGPVLLAVNKPRGVVCTTSDKDRATNVVEMVGYPERIYPIGRLDKDSEGLLLMTNQGELANRIMHAGYLHEKEYLVTVDAPYSEEFLKRMQEGVELKELGETKRP